MKPSDVARVAGRKRRTNRIVESASSAEPLRATLDLFETGVDVMRQNLRRRHPEARAEDIDRLLRAWLLERPGAEYGDSSGHPVAVKTRLA